jgi:hypothetical protein
MSIAYSLEKSFYHALLRTRSVGTTTIGIEAEKTRLLPRLRAFSYDICDALSFLHLCYLHREDYASSTLSSVASLASFRTVIITIHWLLQSIPRPLNQMSSTSFQDDHFLEKSCV